jgi:hypothetical protein
MLRLGGELLHMFVMYRRESLLDCGLFAVTQCYWIALDLPDSTQDKQ